jgi:AAA-like domain
VAHSTEPSLWIADLNQSPFKNVAHEFVIDDFDEIEVADLDVRYGRRLQETAKVEDLIKLVGGHPYLVRLALYTMASKPCSFATLASVAIDEDGPFASHLGHLWNLLHNDDRLLASIRAILRSGKCDDEVLFQRLWSVGLIRGKDRREVWLRYTLYDDYFRKKLL